MIKGFKDFLLRGNVVDLSVAVIMGAAFGAIVTAFTDKIIRPLLNAITPPTSPGLSVQLVSGKPSTVIDIAAVITTVLNFLVVATVVYFIVVLPMKTIQERRKRGEEPGPAEPTEVELLKEIRDLLRGGTAAPLPSDVSAQLAGATDSQPGNSQPAGSPSTLAATTISTPTTPAGATTIGRTSATGGGPSIKSLGATEQLVRPGSRASGDVPASTHSSPPDNGGSPATKA